MHYFGYLNRTFEEETSMSWHIYKFVLHLEIWFIIAKMLHSTIFLNIHSSVKIYHQNWSNIFSFFYILNLIECFFWILQRLLCLLLFEEITIFGFQLSFFVSVGRCCCHFGSYFILALFMIERCCATVFLQTYDNRPRQYISIILIMFGVSLSIFCGITFHLVNTTYIHLSIVVLANISAISMNMFLTTLNKRYHASLRKKHGTYSLTQRYQVTENIKVCKVTKWMLIVFVLFNMISVGLLLTDNFNLGIHTQNVITMAFDINCYAYYLSVPHIVARHSPPLKAELKRLLKDIMAISSSKVSSEQDSAKIRDAFGREMQPREGVADHFSNLQKFWDSSY